MGQFGQRWNGDDFMREIKRKRVMTVLKKDDDFSEKDFLTVNDAEHNANRITSQIVKTFNTSVLLDVWRQNNHATPGRKHNGRLGIADISGTCTIKQIDDLVLKTAIAVRVEIEVKALRSSGRTDTLSQAQKDFHLNHRALGGISIICGSLSEAISKFKAEYFRLTRCHFVDF